MCIAGCFQSLKAINEYFLQLSACQRDQRSETHLSCKTNKQKNQSRFDKLLSFTEQAIIWMCRSPSLFISMLHIKKDHLYVAKMLVWVNQCSLLKAEGHRGRREVKGSRGGEKLDGLQWVFLTHSPGQGLLFYQRLREFSSWQCSSICLLIELAGSSRRPVSVKAQRQVSELKASQPSVKVFMNQAETKHI